MGRNHARVLSKLENVELVAVVDTNLDSIEPPWTLLKSVEELLALGIDYCVISVPTNFHKEVSVRMIQAGVHVLIEKPISDSLNSAHEILDAAIKYKAIVAVGHIERFNSAINEAQKRIRAGQLGAVYQVSTRRQGPFPGRISDVGVIKDLATHDIDITRWITGANYQEISAFAAFRSGRSHEDLVAISGTLDNNVLVNHVVNWLNPLKERNITVMGENGSFEIDTLHSELKFYENGSFTVSQAQLAHFHGVSQGDIHSFAFDKPEPLLVEHQKFLDAVMGKDADIVTLNDAIETLRVAEAASKSYATKSTQKL